MDVDGDASLLGGDDQSHDRDDQSAPPPDLPPPRVVRSDGARP